MSSKRREYHVDCCTKKAALFFLACEANPATRLSIPAAMRAKGYSDVEAVDQILLQQVRRESQKKAPKDTPRPESAYFATGPGDCGDDRKAGASTGCLRHRGGWD